MEEHKNLDKTLTSFEDSENTNMTDLMKGYNESINVAFGKELEVTIIEENADGFIVDFGMKSEGIIPKKEFEEGRVPTELTVGAKVKVKVISSYGQPVLSYREIIEKGKWDALQEVFENKKHVNGMIVKTVRGGFIVDIGVDAFLHISQIDTHFVKETEKYIGKSYDFIITEFDRKKNNIIISRRKIIEDEQSILKASILENIAEGQIIDGTVSNITNFGAFINIGGIDGLLHIVDMAWYKVKKVTDLLHIGQTVRVQVSRVDKVNEKISLSIKSLTSHPWESVDEKFPIGIILKGIVTSVMDYGAFVELEPGVDGLLHASEYTWSYNREALKKEIKKGQEIEVKIIDVNKENKKIALSVKKITENPWHEAFRHYKPGNVVKGIVQNLMPFGAFVRLPEGIEGLIHISDFSWTEKIKHPENVLKKGDEVEVVVIEINPQNEKITFSLKHTKPDPYKKYKVGVEVKGKVISTTDFGAFIGLESGIKVLIKNNEFSYGKSIYQPVLKEGQEVEAKIIKVDLKSRKIEASIKKLEFDRDKELVRKYANTDDKPTLGEILTED
jgi:small subunit ribosomal protein S1